MVTILDVFEKNPYSKVGQPPAFKTMENIRRETAFEVARNEKFRIEANSMKKARAFNKTIQELFINEFVEKGVFDYQEILEKLPETCGEMFQKHFRKPKSEL